jgi:hypothetical protein
MTANYIRGVGRLVTDRYDFQNHIDGNPPHHKAGIITLDPPVVINSVSHTTVQGAIEELAPFAVTVPDATNSTKGKIQLAGDLSNSTDAGTGIKCSASYLQGYNILPTPPTFGTVLSWNGSAWGPGLLPTQLVVGGDLSGLTSNAMVQTISGNNVSVTFNAPILYIKSNTSPYHPIIQHVTTNSGAGQSFDIMAQSSTDSVSGFGGDLRLCSGASNHPSGARDGAITLFVGATHAGFQVGKRTSGNYVTSLVSDYNSTNMPINTGNGVTFIKNATTNPTASAVGGTILYSDTGSLWVKPGAGASSFRIAGDPIVFYTSGTQLNSYDNDMAVWSPVYTTNSLTYVNEATFSTDNSYTAKTGDIIKIHLSGFVGNDTDPYEGYIKLVLVGGATSYDVLGTECAMNGSAVQQISISGSYTITPAENNEIIYASILMRSDIAGDISFYGSAHISMEVIRHT